MPRTAESWRAYYKTHSKERIHYNTEWRKRNPQKVRDASKRRYTELRQKVLTKFGRKCLTCGFTDVRALQIDHVNNDGSLERKKFGRGGTRTFLRIVLKDTEGRYQLLCANCNFIKRLDKQNVET